MCTQPSLKALLQWKVHVYYLYDSDMVQHTTPTEPIFDVGDRVMVINKGSRYYGRFGVVVKGYSGTGFTSTYLSAYVVFEVDKEAFRTLRCTSLAHVNHRPRGRDEQSSFVPPLPARGEPVLDSYHNLLLKLCSELEALTFQADTHANRLIVAFAEEIHKAENQM